jgi:hypothetical protein
LIDLGATFYSGTGPVGGGGLGDSEAERRQALDATLGDYVIKQIGRKTVGRLPVLLVLAGALGGMLLAGAYFQRRGRLERATLVALVLAAAACVALLGLSATRQHAVPLTVASVQVGEVLPHQQQLVATGRLGIYSPIADQGPLQATRGGLVWPDFSAQRGTLIRMTWSDMDRWQWDRLALPQGAILPASFTNVVPLDPPVTATGTFGPEGFIARVHTGPFGKIEDALLLGPSGRVAPRLAPGGAAAGPEIVDLAAGPDDVLGGNQYLGGGMLTDVQNRRQLVYRQMLEHRAGPSTPRLLAWTSDLDLGFVLPERQQAQRPRVTLATMPVTLVRPAAGPVLVPGVFLELRASMNLPVGKSGTRGQPSGRVTIFDAPKGEWNSTASAVTLYLQFQLPEVVRGLKVERGTLTLDIRAPGRTTELLYPPDRSSAGEGRVLESRDGLSGPVVWNLEGARLPAPDADGTITLGLRVNDAGSDAESKAALWQIRSIDLDVLGVMPAAER